MLLGQWLSGEHLDDVSIFDRKDFGEYADVYDQIKTGNHDPIKVYEKTHRKPNDIADLISSSYAPMYNSSVNEMINRKRAELMRNATADNVNEVIEKMQEMCYRSEDLELAHDWCGDLLVEIDSKQREKTMRYGLPLLDRYTRGIHKSEMTTVAARPAVGKSALTLQIAVNLHNQGFKTLYIPLEMSPAQIADRLVCRLSNVPNDNIQSGELTDKQIKELFDMQDKVLEIEKDVMLFPKGRTIEQIRKGIVRYKPDVIVIDQLSLLKGGKGNSIREQFTYYTKELKSMAMEMNIAVLLVAELRRGEGVPTLNDLKESGSIEEDSDNVILLHRTEKDSSFLEQIPTDLIIAKQRNGRTGAFGLKYIGSKFYFREDY